MCAPRCQTCRYDMTGLPLVRCPECGGTAFAERSTLTLSLLCLVNAVAAVSISIGLVLTLEHEQSGGCEAWMTTLEHRLIHGHLKPAFQASALVLLIGPVIAALLAVFRPTRLAFRFALLAALGGHIGLFLLNLRFNWYDPWLAFSPTPLGLVALSGVLAFTLLCVEFWLRIRCTHPPTSTPSSARHALSSVH